VEPPVEHRNATTCRERKTEAVAQPSPSLGTHVDVSRCRTQHRIHFQTGPTGGESSRQQAVHRRFCRSPMGECVSGLLETPQAHKGTDKVGWQNRGSH
jgi:hypothetical protein